MNKKRYPFLLCTITLVYFYFIKFWIYVVVVVVIVVGISRLCPVTGQYFGFSAQCARFVLANIYFIEDKSKEMKSNSVCFSASIQGFMCGEEGKIVGYIFPLRSTCQQTHFELKH